MHFLFIYSSGGHLGGMQTLAVRMTRWLVKNGHKVTLLIKSGDKWAHLLPKEARCIALGERFGELAYYYHARRLWESLDIPAPDVIKSFDMRSLWTASMLASITGNKCKVIAGEYSPSVFKWFFAPKSLRPWHGDRLYLENYLRCIPENARVFCGVDQIEELQDVHHQNGLLWPLPIDTREFDAAERKPKWGRIVSVGRLSPMKEYNLYMIDIVKELIAKGQAVTWSVYGAGEYEAEMRESIRKHKLEAVISIEGVVPYRRFWEVLSDAYIFVGMGTALLEAALFKVPNFCALPYDRTGLTYGSSRMLPPGSNGQLSTVKPGNMKVEIERILALSPAEYETEAQLVLNHVQVHQIDASMGRFLEIAQQAGPMVQRSQAHYLMNYPLWFASRVMKWLGEDQAVYHPAMTNATFGAKQPS